MSNDPKGNAPEPEDDFDENSYEFWRECQDYQPKEDWKDAAAAWGETAERIAQAWDNANEEWQIAALQAAFIVANELSTFTSIDIWTCLEQLFPDAKTHEGRAMGPLLNEVRRRGWARRTNQMRSVSYPCGGSRGLNPIWRSRLA